MNMHSPSPDTRATPQPRRCTLVCVASAHSLFMSFRGQRFPNASNIMLTTQCMSLLNEQDTQGIHSQCKARRRQRPAGKYRIFSRNSMRWINNRGYLMSDWLHKRAILSAENVSMCSSGSWSGPCFTWIEEPFVLESSNKDLLSEFSASSSDLAIQRVVGLLMRCWYVEKRSIVPSLKIAQINHTYSHVRWWGSRQTVKGLRDKLWKGCLLTFLGEQTLDSNMDIEISHLAPSSLSSPAELFFLPMPENYVGKLPQTNMYLLFLFINAISTEKAS